MVLGGVHLSMIWLDHAEGKSAHRYQILFAKIKTIIHGTVLITVLGATSPSELGVTLPHEQPLVDLTGLFMEVPARYSGGRDPRDIANLNFQLSDIAKIRQFP